MTPAERIHAEVHRLDKLPNRIRELAALLDEDLEQRGTDCFNRRLATLADDVERYIDCLFAAVEDAMTELDGEQAEELRLLDGAAAA